MAESSRGGAAVAEPIAARAAVRAGSTKGLEPERALGVLTPPLGSRSLVWAPPPPTGATPPSPLQTASSRHSLRLGAVTITGEWERSQLAPVVHLLDELLPRLNLTGHPFTLQLSPASEPLAQRGARGSASSGLRGANGSTRIELLAEDALRDSARQRYLLAHEAAHLAQQRRSQPLAAVAQSVLAAEIEAHEIASAFARHSSFAQPRIAMPAGMTLYDTGLEQSLKEQVAGSRAKEIEYVKHQLKGWVSSSDVHRALLTLQSLDFFVARAVMQNVEPKMRRKLVENLDANDAKRFRTEVFAAYAAMETDEVRHFGAELFDKVDLHELTPHEHYAAHTVLEKFPKKGEELRGTKNAFAIAVIQGNKLTNEAISDEQLEKARSQEGQVAEQGAADAKQALSSKEQADYSAVTSLLSKRFFFFPPSQSKVRQALELLSTYRSQPDRMRLLAQKLDQAELLDRLVEHAPVKALVQEQLSDSSADGKSGPVLLPTFLMLVSFRPAYRNIALAEDLSRQTWFRSWISNIGSEQAFLALQLIKSAPDRMKESFAADTDGDFLAGIRGELDPAVQESVGVNLYGGGVHQRDRAQIESALLDESLWSEARLPELNARIRMANAAGDRRFVFDQSAKMRAWQRSGLLPLVEQFKLYNPQAVGPDGKRAPRTAFVAPDPAHRANDRSKLSAIWHILGQAKIRENGVEVTDLDLLDVKRILAGQLAGIEFAGAKNSKNKETAAAPSQSNRVQHLIWNTDTRQFTLDAELVEIASIHRLAATRVDSGAGLVSGIHVKGVLNEGENLKTVIANIGRMKLSDIVLTMGGSIATIAELEVSDLEFRLGAELDFSTLPRVEISGLAETYIPVFRYLLNPLVTVITFIRHALRGKDAMIKALKDTAQSGLRIGGIKASGIYLSSGEHIQTLAVEGIELRSGDTLDAYQAEIRAAAKALGPEIARATEALGNAGPGEQEAYRTALARLQKRLAMLQSQDTSLDEDRATLKALEAKEKHTELTPLENDRLQQLRRGGALLSVASAQVSGVGGQLSADSVTLSDVQGIGRTSSDKTRPVLAGGAGKADFQVTAGCFSAVNAAWKSSPEDSVVLRAQADKLQKQIEQLTKAGESVQPLQVRMQLLQARLKDTLDYERYAERGIATLTPEEAAQFRLLGQKLSDTSSVAADRIEAHDLALSISADSQQTSGGASASLLTITGVHYRRTETALQQERAQLEAVENPTSAQKARLLELNSALAELQSLRFRQKENAVSLEKASGTAEEAGLREQKAELDAGLERWSQDQRVAESVELQGPHVTVSAAGGLIGGDKSFDQLVSDGLHVSGGFERLEIKKPEFQNEAGSTKAADITAGPFEGTFDVSNTGLNIENLSLGNLDVTGLEYQGSEQSLKASGNIGLRGLVITKGRVVYEDEVTVPDKAAKDGSGKDSAGTPDAAGADKKSESKKKATTLHCDEMRIASISGNALAFSKQMPDGQKLDVTVPHGSLMAIALKNFTLALPADGSDMERSGHAEIGKTEITGLNGKLGRSLEASASIRAGKVSADFASSGRTVVDLNDVNVLNAHYHDASKPGALTDVQFNITHVGGKVAVDADGNMDIDLKPTMGVEVKQLHWKSGKRELTSNKPAKLESVELHASLRKDPDGSIKSITIRKMRVTNISAEALRYQDAPIDLHLDQDLADKDAKAFSIREIELNQFVYSPKKGILGGEIVSKDISAAVSGDFYDQVKGGLRLDAKGISAHFYQGGAFSTDIDGLSAKFKGSAYGAEVTAGLDGFSAHVYMGENSIVVQNLGFKSLGLEHLNFDSPEFRITLPQGAGHAQVKALAADFVILLKPPPKPGSIPPGSEAPSRLQAITISKLHIDEISADGMELEIKGKAAADGGPPAASTLVRLPAGQPLTLSGIDLDGPDLTNGSFVIDKTADGATNLLGGLKVGTAELKQLQVATAKSFQLSTAIHAGGIRLDFLSGGKKRVSVSTLSVTDLNALLGEKSSTDAKEFAANFTDPGTGITVKVASAHIEPDPLKKDEPPLVVDLDGNASLTQLVIDDAQFIIPDIMEALKSPPPDPAKAKDAAPAAPGLSLKDWKFLDTLQGWIRLDLVAAHFDWPLQINVTDGKFNAWETLDRVLGGFFGIFGKLEIQDNILALELDLTALPQDEGAEYNLDPPKRKFNMVEVPLSPEELESARHGMVPLAAFTKARTTADLDAMLKDDDNAPKKPAGTPKPVPDGVHLNNISSDLYTAGSSTIDLGAAGKIIVGPGGQPGLSHLRLSGNVSPKDSAGNVQRNQISVDLAEANVGLENFQVAGVGLNMGRLTIEDVHNTKLTFPPGILTPKSLSGQITKATARDVKIDFSQLMKKPEAGKDAGKGKTP